MLAEAVTAFGKERVRVYGGYIEHQIGWRSPTSIPIRQIRSVKRGFFSGLTIDTASGKIQMMPSKDSGVRDAILSQMQ